MLFNNNILSYLLNDTILTSEKEKIIKNKKDTLRKIYDNLNCKDILSYLLNDNICSCLKEDLSLYIDDILIISNKNKYEKLKTMLNNKLYLKKEYLNSKNYPKLLKELIIDDLYNVNLIDLICSNKVSYDDKKNIIDIKFNTKDEIFKLLKEKNLQEDLKEYIINTKFNYDMIKFSLFDYNISYDVKLKVINRCININNIFDILQSFLIDDSLKNEIYKLKENEINSYVESLKYNSILREIYKKNIPDSIINKIIEVKSLEIKKEINNLDYNELYIYLISFKNDSLLNMLVNDNKKKFNKLINKLNAKDFLNILNNEYVSNDIKNNIMKRKKIAINNVIKKENFNFIRNNFLREYSCVPENVKQKIISIKTDDIICWINSLNEEDIEKIMLYGNLCQELKEMLINKRINNKNIFKVLSNNSYDNKFLELIVKLKKVEIEKYLNSLNVEELIKLDKIGLINSKNVVINNNYKLIKNKLIHIDKNKIHEYLNSRFTPILIKKIILENLNEQDIIKKLELIEHNDSKLLLDNYDDIKKIMEDNNINFDLFIQYGCGSIKYNNWLINLINIIKNNKEKDFRKVVSYLFNNYYNNGYNNEINKVSMFLEIVSNFSNNYVLLNNLSNNNKILTDSDKILIKFIFSIDEDKNEKIMSLNDIDLFKNNLINKYNKKIDQIDDINKLKDMFNGLVFSFANITLENIGGIATLQGLKKDNLLLSNYCKSIDEIIYYSKIIEKLSLCKDIKKIKSLFKHILCCDDINFIKINDLFSKFDNKVSKLFENDANINLTNLDQARCIKGVIDEKKSLNYGGEVFDFSDKNYVLYAHVLSENEKIEDIINGKSSSNKNFISVSPVSYLGQKFYLDNSNVIIAFDSINNDSYICGSLENLSSNYCLIDNSLEVPQINRKQRGILETSAVTDKNSEVLLYRNGMKAKGLILPGGRKPTNLELEIHRKYDIPFIITQNEKCTINNVNNCFEKTDIKSENISSIKFLEKIYELFDSKLSCHNIDSSDIYTGKQIALISDLHSMYEPSLEVLEDIRRNKIDEIYSLGDNVGVGVNPDEVFDMLSYYKVKSISGNNEYYNTLGFNSFGYLKNDRLNNAIWTKEKLKNERIEIMKSFPVSIDIELGGKKIALCHFANDIRWDFENSTWTYQNNFIKGKSSKQFLYTNSDLSNKKINAALNDSDLKEDEKKGYLLAVKEPLFDGKKILDYDAIIQGHIHFEMDDYIKNTKIFTLRALAIGYSDDDYNMACYYVLKEKKQGGFDIEKRLVKFNKNSLLANIQTSNIPDKNKILRFIK